MREASAIFNLFSVFGRQKKSIKMLKWNNTKIIHFKNTHRHVILTLKIRVEGAVLGDTPPPPKKTKTKMKSICSPFLGENVHF